MKAETAYIVIQALPEPEQLRLYAMIDKDRAAIDSIAAVQPKSKLHIWTVAECTEELLATIFNKNKKAKKQKYSQQIC